MVTFTVADTDLDGKDLFEILLGEPCSGLDQNHGGGRNWIHDTNVFRESQAPDVHKVQSRQKL